MELSEDNPTGVRSYNHDDLADLPEYHEARAALQHLISAIAFRQHSGDWLMLPQADWLEAVSDFGRSAQYTDNCRKCEDSLPAGVERMDYLMTFPYAIAVDGKRGLTASYRCRHQAHEWETWWSLKLPDI
jgi:hypothetical protein